MEAETATSTIMQVNGIATDPSRQHRYDAFYERILRLQDEVLAGKHPRLKLAGPEAARLRVLLSSSTLAGAVPAVHEAANRAPMDQYTLHSPHVTQLSSAPSGFIPGLSDGGRKPASTSIDPVLLEKSDDLIRAEIQLKRMRIERALGVAVEERKMEIKAMEPEATFEISDVLAKAQEAVVPISGFPPPSEDKSTSNGSFDENSYYSSQAMSWSTENSEDGVQGADMAELATIHETNHASNTAVHIPAPKAASGLPTSTFIPLSSFQPGANAGQEGEEDAYSPPPLIATPLQPSRVPETQALVSVDIEEEDMDYEPPAPDALPTLQTQHSMPQAQRPLNGAVFYGNLISADTATLPTTSPTNDVPIHRNHIETPLAPQPARVSPLATTKIASVDRNPSLQGALVQGGVGSPAEQARRQKQNGSDGAERPSPKTSAQQSPAGPRNGVNNPRKRRRETDNDRRRGKRVAKSPARSPQAARSPEPFIKEEPQSPQPLARISDTQGSRRRAYNPHPDDVEIISPREYRPRTHYLAPYETRPHYIYDDEAEPGPLRIYPRTGYRVVDRQDQDLRRVASLQYARRPYSPIASQPILPADNRPLRAASYAYSDRPVTIQPSYREVSVRPPRYSRADLSQSPPQDVYLRRVQSPVMMAPPPKPVIVEDDYGNRYYAAPPPGPPMDIRASMAPPSWRPRESDPYVERAMTREPTLRPPPLYDEENRQFMPPPPARRFADPETEMLEHPVYRAREFSVRPGEELRYAQEPIERRPLIRSDDMPPPPPQRDYLARSYSVRPEALPRASLIREVPAMRYSSVAPGAEYMRHPQPLEPAFDEDYGRVDQRGYVSAPQHSRLMYGERRLERGGDDLQAAYGNDGRRVNYHY